MVFQHHHFDHDHHHLCRNLSWSYFARQQHTLYNYHHTFIHYLYTHIFIIYRLYYARQMRPHSLTAQSAGKTFVATFPFIIIIIIIIVVVVVVVAAVAIVIVMIVIMLFSGVRLPVES